MSVDRDTPVVVSEGQADATWCVSQTILRSRALDADGADEQAHRLLLPGEDVLDRRGHRRFGDDDRYHEPRDHERLRLFGEASL